MKLEKNEISNDKLFYYYYRDSKTGIIIDHGLWNDSVYRIGYHYHGKNKGFSLTRFKYKNNMEQLNKNEEHDQYVYEHIIKPIIKLEKELDVIKRYRSIKKLNGVLGYFKLKYLKHKETINKEMIKNYRYLLLHHNSKTEN